jgi:hypothetical protein
LYAKNELGAKPLDALDLVFLSQPNYLYKIETGFDFSFKAVALKFKFQVTSSVLTTSVLIESSTLL